MIKLTENDFAPLETFEYKWRWTSGTHLFFSEQELAQLRPLSQTKASELWTYTEIYWDELGKHLWTFLGGQLRRESKVNLFAEPVHVLPAKDVPLYPQVEQELWQLDSQQDLMVIVQWEPRLALATPWSLFCSYWDSFCYPAMDDVRIFPVSESWFLAYTHNQYLTFGRLYELEREKALREQLAQHALLFIPKPLVNQGEVVRLLKTGVFKDKVAAIRLYNQETEIGFAKSKEIIDTMLEEMKRKELNQSENE